MKNKRVFVLDNYDSFTYNLIQYIGSVGAETIVKRNDKVSISEVEKINPDCIVISPGPGRSEDAGISMDLIKSFEAKLPILGVCLGHQCIAQVYGGKIVQAKRIVHGKTSMVTHDKKDVLFKGVDNPFPATRYHSLVMDPEKIPDFIQVTAWSDDKEVMGLKHKKFAIWGVQFHPESILTEPGLKIIENFLNV